MFQSILWRREALTIWSVFVFLIVTRLQIQYKSNGRITETQAQNASLLSQLDGEPPHETRRLVPASVAATGNSPDTTPTPTPSQRTKNRHPPG